ncbi:MAG: hypothetical protein R2726_12070 [Acidimicrobiales bacterium]
MDEHDKAPVSRRALIAGAGGVAGAVALGGVAATSAAAATPPIGPGDPTTGAGGSAQAVGYPPLVVTPGIHYRTWGLFAFRPNQSANGLTVTPSGAYCPSSGGYLVAPVDLEANSLLTDLTVGVTNSSGGNATFYLESFPIAGGASTAVGTIDIPSGAVATIQVGSTVLSHTVNANTTYDAAIYTPTSGSIRVFSMRLGYVPFGYGFTPITPTRVYDSRAGNPPLGVTKGQLSNGTRVVNMLNGLMLPVTPKGVLCNLTVVNTSASGFISLYKNGSAWPGTSSINWFAANEIVANTAYTDVDASGQAIAKVPANSSTDFFIDAVGYYA